MNRAAAFAAVAALTLVAIVPAPYATLWPDTVRDLSASLALARGEAVPLVGPSINFGPHLGPAWIWLQALALVAVPSLAAASVFVAVVSALKFPLLFCLGRTLSGDRLGLAFAASAAFPSIAAYQWMVFFHPSWVEAAIALTLLLVGLAVKRRSLFLAYASAAALGFAIQMHPTALFYAPFVGFAFLAAGARGWRWVLHGLGASILVLGWFAPVAFAGDYAQLEKLGEVSTRAGAGVSGFAPGDLLAVLRSAYVDVPVAIGATHAAALGVPLALWNVALAIAGLGALAGLALLLSEQGASRWTLVLLAAFLLAGWTAAAAIRSYTSFYLCYFLLPLSALVFGAGLDRLAASPRAALRAWGVGAIGLAMTCFAIAAVGARAVGRSGEMVSRLPALSDLKHPGPEVRAGLITAAARDAAAIHLCRASPTPVLHGELAFALAASTGLDTRLHCPARNLTLRVLGSGDGQPGLTTLAVAHAKALSRVPAAHFRGLAAFPAKAIHPRVARPVERDWHYFERLRDRTAAAPVALEFTTGPATHVVVYRMKPFDSSWRAFRVTRDSVPIEPALSTYNSDLFASTGAVLTHWRVEFETDAPGWVDVHAF